MVRKGLAAALFGFIAVRLCAAKAPYCPVLYTKPPTGCEPIPTTFLSFSTDGLEPPHPGVEALEDAFDALEVLQRDYFNANYGTWPSAIDWTAAVTGTAVAGMLTTLSKSLDSVDLGSPQIHWRSKENLISSFFAQLVDSYFNQDIISLRGQAYDDMLWVVLEWLEAIRFVSVHSRLHYSRNLGDNAPKSGGLRHALESLPWHGSNWVSSFAHRARIFWNLASEGWGTQLCHGGMVWNPRLSPYKNAITNELWIAASISMYLYFPGDNFTSPWVASNGFPKKDPAHMAAAIEGYRWLMGVNMTNSQGLFVDGYHIDNAKPGNVECDVRDEMVYTYNQGVILTGQRGLWTVSGAVSYLMEGHKLVQSVINATGWSLKHNAPVDDLAHLPPGRLPLWRGIGRGGILEEQCDASGTCSQDAQTFKGIFFHHLTEFCGPLEPFHVERGVTVDTDAYHTVRTVHAEACRSYLGWVQHNARAAQQTRDSQGRFGMWWGASLFNNTMVSEDHDGIDHGCENTTDYRNEGTPEDNVWGGSYRWLPGSGGIVRADTHNDGLFSSHIGEKVMGGPRKPNGLGSIQAPSEPNKADSKDPNNRGRGRTVETQVGGLELLRSYWEMSRPS